jgi:hypothetical protein
MGRDVRCIKRGQPSYIASYNGVPTESLTNIQLLGRLELRDPELTLRGALRHK